MVLSRKQLEWIDENRDSIDNRDLDKLIRVFMSLLILKKKDSFWSY